MVEGEEDSESPIIGEVIFILLNLMFFITLFIFVQHTTSSVYVYEQAYAKEIALAIDNSKQNTEIYLDAQILLDAAKENNIDLTKIVKIDNEKHKVIVQASSNGGYSYYFFTDADIKSEFAGEYLKININPKTQ